MKMTLSGLRREIAVGTTIKIVHDNALMGNTFGMKMRITKATKRGFYYVPCESENVRRGSCYDYALMNDGKGAFLEYGRVNQWECGGYSMKYDYYRKRENDGNDMAFIIL